MLRLILILGLFITGCTTKQDHEDILNSWLGSSEEDIVTSWGPPNGFYENGDTRYLTWSESRSGVIPGTPTTYTTTNYGGIVTTSTNYGTAPIIVNTNCSITMIVQSGSIVNWTYKGNSCYDF